MPQSPRCLSLEQALAELVNLRASVIGVMRAQK
jgi:hypothetical protein